MSAPSVAPAQASPRWFAGDTTEPTRSTPVGIVCTTVLVVTYMLGNVLGSVSRWAPLVLAVVTVLALAARATLAVHVGLLTLLHSLAWRVPVVGGMWPINNLSALVAYAAIVLSFRPLRETSGWLRRGRVDRVTRLAIAAFSLTSAVALVAWRYGAHVNMSVYRRFVPAFALTMPGWELVVALPVGVLAFAMLNAAFEEVIWRGVIMQSLESAFGRGALVCVLQAVGFGVWHFRGFPSGYLGSALATIFALMMGVLRMRGRGMLAPWLAHVCADTTIFILVAAMVLGS